MYERFSRHPMDRSMRRLFRAERACDGHHVIARRSSARRHRQGPKAARVRGRSEAQRLARCRAQMQHRCRDGRGHYTTARCAHLTTAASRHRMQRARAPLPGQQLVRQACAKATSLRPTFFRTNRTGSSGRSESQSSAVRCAKHAALLAAERTLSNHVERQ
jgi:hypothetical protein